MAADYRAEATAKTPSIALEARAGTLRIEGVCIPENADRVFAPLFEAIERYAQQPAPRTVVSIHLTFFNSSSAKYLLDVLKRVEDLHALGQTRATLEWYHAPGDLDMMEAGCDYKSLLEFPVRLVEQDY
ncbi:MAG: DUF1987 domain-containing protein [Flavobacteriales bacterium]